MTKFHIMPKKNYDCMRKSIMKLIDMFYREEEKHFGEEDESFDEFLIRIKEHVLYDLIVVFNNGSEEDIMDDIKGIYISQHPDEVIE